MKPTLCIRAVALTLAVALAAEPSNGIEYRISPIETRSAIPCPFSSQALAVPLISSHSRMILGKLTVVGGVLGVFYLAHSAHAIPWAAMAKWGSVAFGATVAAMSTLPVVQPNVGGEFQHFSMTEVEPARKSVEELAHRLSIHASSLKRGQTELVVFQMTIGQDQTIDEASLITLAPESPRVIDISNAAAAAGMRGLSVSLPPGQQTITMTLTAGMTAESIGSLITLNLASSDTQAQLDAWVHERLAILETNPAAYLSKEEEVRLAQARDRGVNPDAVKAVALHSVLRFIKKNGYLVAQEQGLPRDLWDDVAQDISIAFMTDTFLTFNPFVARLTTYVGRMIHWHGKRRKTLSYSRQVQIPRGLEDLLTQYGREYLRLQQELMREPTRGELALAMRCSEETIIQLELAQLGETRLDHPKRDMNFPRKDRLAAPKTEEPEDASEAQARQPRIERTRELLVGLSPFHALALYLLHDGWDVQEVSDLFGLSRNTLNNVVRDVRARQNRDQPVSSAAPSSVPNAPRRWGWLAHYMQVAQTLRGQSLENAQKLVNEFYQTNRCWPAAAQLTRNLLSEVPVNIIEGVILICRIRKGDLRQWPASPTLTGGLLKAFRAHDADRPMLDEETVRKLYLIRDELQPEDLLWLSKELADGRVSSEKAQEWLFYLFYQRERPWTGMTSETREQITALLHSALQAKRLSSNRYALFLYPIWAPVPHAESIASLGTDLRSRWQYASVDEKMTWIRIAGARARARKGTMMAEQFEMCAEIGITLRQLKQMKHFKRASPLPPLALGIMSYKLNPEVVHAATVLAKDSPDDILFQNDLEPIIGRTAYRLQMWALSELHDNPSIQNPSTYLLREYELLSERDWAYFLIERDSTKPPSLFECHVATTFIRLAAGSTPLLEMTEQGNFRREFVYRGHTLSLRAFVNNLRDLAPPGDWGILHFILLRYHLLPAEHATISNAMLSEIGTIDLLREAMLSGKIKHFSWRVIHKAHPELIGEIVRALGLQVGKPGKGTLWLEVHEDYGKKFDLLSGLWDGQIMTLHGLCKWAQEEWHRDQAPNKPKTPILYLAKIGGFEIESMEDVRMALENRWISKMPYADIPDPVIDAFIPVAVGHLERLSGLPFGEINDYRQRHIFIPGFQSWNEKTQAPLPITFYGFFEFLKKRHEGQRPPPALKEAA